MYFIPGWFISLLTFPGIVCHEIAHRFFCDLAGVPVYAVSYFRFGNPAGYVVHGPVSNLKDAFLISIGPLLVNTLLCSLLTFSAFIPIFGLNVAEANPASMLLLWAGISMGMHAFPSGTDMDSFRAQVKNSGGSGAVHALGMFLSVLFKIAHGLRMMWFDAIYALLVASFLPWLLLGLWWF
jgi:hypothetical protein